MPEPETINSGQRCCPQCGGTQFWGVSPCDSTAGLQGYTLQCTGCGWLGFHLQLKPKEQTNG